MSNRLFSSVFLGGLLLCCQSAAAAFDTDAAARVLNPNSPKEAQSAADQAERDFIESSKAEINRENRKAKKEKIVLPDECRLISYTSDGISSRYKCKDYEILTIITVPQENLTTEQIAGELSRMDGCESMPANSLGMAVSCDTNDGKYVSYFIDLPSKLRENLITSADYNNPEKIEAIVDVSHSIYFYMRRVARDQEQIDYLTDILSSAARLTLEKKPETDAKKEDR